jgi:hypothetical protein
MWRFTIVFHLWPLSLPTSSSSVRICCDIHLPWYRFSNVVKAFLSLFRKSILAYFEEAEIWIKTSDIIYIAWCCRNWEFPQQVTRNFLPWLLRRKLCSQLKTLFSFTYIFIICAASQTSLLSLLLASLILGNLRFIYRNHCHFDP